MSCATCALDPRDRAREIRFRRRWQAGDWSFVGGQTGCFWDLHRGIPPMSTPALLRLRDLALEEL